MFMVLFDDQMGLVIPMGLDPDCEGAIRGDTNKPVVFDTKEQAKKAICISKCFARLQKEQGKVYNSDFIECASLIRIVKVGLIHDAERTDSKS